MARRYYSSTFSATTLSSGVGAADTLLSVASVAGAPASLPWTGVIDRGTSSEELVEVTNISGTTLTITRGIDGTTGKTHSAGASFEHVVSARDFDEANAHVNDSTTDVHAQYVKKAGGDTITASAAGVIPLVVKGAASQTANLLSATTSAGATPAYIDNNGGIRSTFAIVAGDQSVNAGTYLQSTSLNAGVRGLVVRGAASQTANLAEFQDSAGAVKVSVGSGGGVYVNTVYDGGAMNTTTGVAAAAAGVKGLVVRGAASQTANLAEFQRSDGTVASFVRSDGLIGATTGIYARPLNTGTYGLLVQGLASQSANLVEIQNSAGTVLSNFRASGQLDLFLADTAGGSQGTRLVALGAPDSGGTGRRVLTVPN